MRHVAPRLPTCFIPSIFVIANSIVRAVAHCLLPLSLPPLPTCRPLSPLKMSLRSPTIEEPPLPIVVFHLDCLELHSS
ncbi:hypothetical protein K438DRAFT_1981117 [Mycena galopus ATCC 62051]|nr:hypothetical protein K438DRAFT_1981117 [Mycena galopus ATCC 62051]